MDHETKHLEIACVTNITDLSHLLVVLHIYFYDYGRSGFWGILQPVAAA